MPESVDTRDRDHRDLTVKPAGVRPSEAWLRAVASGLLGLGVACDSTDPVREEADPVDGAHDQEPENCAPVDGGTPAEATDAATSDAGATGTGHNGQTGTTSPDEEVEKELNTENVQHTNTELKQLCDERGGYLENHASCSGVNTCKGFTYGDWDEDAQLIEHTCSGVNGCGGLSCRTMADEPEGGGLTGKEILELDDTWYEERAGAYGPKSCRTCHIVSEFSEELGDYVYDYTQLKIPVWAKDKRTAENWTERSVAYQEAAIAFGVAGISVEDGQRYSNMAAYDKLFSKAEIQRVVEYMRGYDPKNITIKEIKLKPGKAE